MEFDRGLTYEELQEGMASSFSKTVTETDVALFAAITGDFNPLHMNEEFCKGTQFGKRIAHGGIPQALVAAVLGMKLPGLGTVVLELTTRFVRPTFIGDTITARAEVAEKLEEKKWVRFNLTWTNQHNKEVCSGQVLVKPPQK